MDLKRQSDIDLWWGTPVQLITCPGAEQVNPGLKAIILDRMKTSPGIFKSNVGGWHSTDDLMSWGGPEIDALRGWIVDAFKDVTQRTSRGQGYKGKVHVSAWANVNGQGHGNDIHNHPHSAWSGVYYVDVGTDMPAETRSGFIQFYEPRQGAGMVEDPFSGFGKGREVKPKSGQMMLFPGWLLHSVRPYYGEGERISIAFNLLLADLM